MINLKFLLQPHHKYKHHTVWRTWLFIACSDERCLYYQFSQSHIYISLSKGWENVLFELGSERGAYENCNEGAMYSQNTVILFQIKHRTHVVFRMYLCFSSSVKPRYVSFPSPSPPNFTVLCSLMNCKGANTSPQEGGMGGGRGGTTAGKTFALDTPTESPENRLVCLKTDKEKLGENTGGNGKESKRRRRVRRTVEMEQTDSKSGIMLNDLMTYETGASERWKEWSSRWRLKSECTTGKILCVAKKDARDYGTYNSDDNHDAVSTVSW